MSELEIPDAAIYAAAQAAYVDLKIHSTAPIEAALYAAAPLIVAAELRRIASMTTSARFRTGYLIDRANELDPQQ